MSFSSERTTAIASIWKLNTKDAFLIRKWTNKIKLEGLYEINNFFICTSPLFLAVAVTL
jgi:hypothetical protein